MIQLKNITKKYGNFTAVDNISLDIKDGEIIGLLGANGAGKTTTMNMITGYIEPTDGQIIINGNDISKKPLKAKKQIGYMPENVPLYTDLTVIEFIKYMAELRKVEKTKRKEEIQRVIKETGLEDVAKKQIKNLSRGYKQRVSLSGALVGNPDILILDEPTVGLDPKQVTEIRNLIKSLGKDHTVIISSHILSEINQMCNKVVIIDKGKIIETDTPENLENKVKNENVILLTVEDEKNKIKEVLNQVNEIKNIMEIKDNQDGTKQYKITIQGEEDLRKTIFEILAKQEITIFEMKKPEVTLEDAFIDIIGKNKKEDEN